MAMKTINPEDAYDKQKFVGAMKDFSKLEELLQGISDSKGNWTPDFRIDLGELLRSNPTFYAELTPDTVITDANEAYGEHQKRVQNYAIKNFDTLLRKINRETLLKLVTSVLPVAKTGRKSLDKAIEAINEKRKIAEAAEKGDIQGYVNEKLKKAKDWRKSAYFGYNMGGSGYVQRTFQAYAQSAEQDLAKEVLDSDGNIKTDVLLEIAKENYNKLVAKDTEKADKAAKAYLSAIAQSAYESVKPEKKDKPGKIARTGQV